MEIIHGDITKVKVDAVVNAANTQLKHGGGVACAVVKAGGEIIQQESNKIGWCDIGKAVATTAGKLPAKYVIHVPTIDYLSCKKADFDDIKKGTQAAFKLAKKLGCRSIAFPLLGAGVVGLRKAEVQKVIEKVASLFPEINSYLLLKKLIGPNKVS